VLPVKDAGDYLAEAVASILAQEQVTLELLIIDDHSKDQAISQLKIDSRCRVLRSPGSGLVDALNYGLAQARYGCIARMDADDIAHPTRLATQLQYMSQHPEVDICGCVVAMFSEVEVAQGYQHYEKWINSLLTHEQIVRDFFIESPIAHPSAVFNKALIQSIGGYQQGDWPEDYELWCRALMQGCKFGKPCSQPLLYWRDYPTRTSRTDSRYRKRAFIQCKAHALADQLRTQNIQNVLIWGTGPTGLALHDALESEQCEVNGFVDISPKMAGRYKRGKSVHVVNLETDTITPATLLNPHQHLLVAVAARGAREQMRSYLGAHGWEETKHYTLAA